MSSIRNKIKIFLLASLVIVTPMAWFKSEVVEDSVKYAVELGMKINLEFHKNYGSANSSDILHSMFSNAKGTLEDHVANYLLIPPSDKPYNIQKFTSDYRILINSLTWKPINEYVRHLFDTQSSGFFIEAGALDGIALSNSLWLETEKNWTGLLVEPDSVNFLALQKKNRKAWKINACLSTSTDPKIVTLKSFRPANHDSGQTGNFWFFHGRSTIIDEYDKGFASPHYQSDYSRVLCLPVGLLLKALNVTVVDIFSLDIEGNEFAYEETITEQIVTRKLVPCKDLKKHANYIIIDWNTI